MNAITLPSAMLKRLEKISASSRRSPEAIVKQAITEKLEYEEWALRQIDAGLADVKAGRVISHDEFLKSLEQARHERKRKKAA
jgi:RHH-type transcriptional regulator, rel operon repressor / antitoxin RelB